MNFNDSVLKASFTGHLVANTVIQQCLLCENTREVTADICSSSVVWVCEDCKEAIAFIKARLKHDPLTPILD